MKLFVFAVVLFVSGFIAFGVTGNIEAAAMIGIVVGLFFARYA